MTLVAALLAACWTPIYDERVSSAALLSLKLDSLAIERPEIGPAMGNIGSGGTDYEFLPSKSSNLDCGLLIERGASGINADYLGKPDAADPCVLGTSSLSFSQGFGSRTLFLSASVGAPYAAQIVAIGLAGPGQSHDYDLRSFVRNPAASTDLTDAGSILPTGVPMDSAAVLVAAGTVLDQDGADDDIELLYWDPASQTYERYGLVYNSSTAPVVDGPYTVSAGGALAINEGSRFFRLKGNFYLSAYSGAVGSETVHSFKWTSAGSLSATLAAAPVELPSITAPIVGILSTESLILAQDNLFLYCFDANGNLVFKVPAGELLFEQEFAVDGTICALLSQPILIQNNNQTSISARVWAMPSSMIRALAE